MRQYFRPSLSALCLLLALVIPSLLVVEAARSKPSSPAGRKTSDDAGRRASQASEPDAATAASVRQKYGQLPLSFEENRGQADARVQFLARNGAYSLYLTADEAALAMRDASVLRIRLLGANRAARARGLEELESKSNYLVGRDPSRWRTNVPNFARVKYEGVYPGVDVVYYGNQRQLEYDFHLAAGADPNLIRLSVEGADGLRIDEGGDLVLPTAAGEVRQHAPRAYQDVAGVSRAVACRYVLKGGDRVGFELGDYDKTLPLVIDPVVSYSTYLGGRGTDEATSITVDAEGYAYIAGTTNSYNFPVTPGAYQSRRRGAAPNQMVFDAFVAKLNHDGTALVYSTYIGGTGDEDNATSIAVDATGQAHIAGFTNSTDFPASGGVSGSNSGGRDLFVAKLDPTGSMLLYSSYLGGSGDEMSARLALGLDGEIYVGGQTFSADYPVTPGAFRTQPGVPIGYASDGFVTKLMPLPNTGLIFSTFVGGSGFDSVQGLAVSNGWDDSVYVTGSTQSTDFPVTPNALRTTHASGGSSDDAFVTRLNATGTAAIFSTYLGGEDSDSGGAIAVDADGSAYVAGLTHSQYFPITPGVFQPEPAGGGDVFVAKLRSDGQSLVYSGFFGGGGSDSANAIAIDAAGNAYVAGMTSSFNLPVTPDASRTSYGGGFSDGFLFKLNPTGTAVPYATYLGGTDFDTANGIAVGPDGAVYVTGGTYSYDFNVTPLALQQQRGDGPGGDAFVARFALDATHYSITGRVTNQYNIGLEGAEVTVSGGFNATTFTDSDGYYKLSGIPVEAEVMLLATRFGFTFTPQTVVFKDVKHDMSVHFFGHAPLRISGRVVDEYGNGIYVPISLLSAAGTTESFTNWDGSYSFIVPGNAGNYTVTPGPDPERVYTPPSQTFSSLIGDTTFDFVGTFSPRILGRVVDEYGNVLPNIRVTLTSPALQEPRVEMAGDYGFFTFYDLQRGADYTVTAVEPGTNRTFAPAEYVINDIEGPHYITITSLPPVNIGGRVWDAGGNPVMATVKLTGSDNREVQTFESGYFVFSDLPRGGNYTVTVSKPGTLYTFEPPSRTVENLQDLSFLEFTALPPIRIVGRVADRDNNPLRATVTLSGAVNRTTQANEIGLYIFEDLPRGGDYTVTPAYPLYTFEPASQSVTNAQDENIIFPFEALPPLQILGSMLDEEGNRVAGATVTLSGTLNRTTTTNEYGVYNFTELPRGGAYTVTPTHELYNFEPAQTEFADMGSDQLAVFNAVFRRFTLNGRVADANGAGISGVNVLLGGGYADVKQTDADGNYAFANLRVGRNYTVTPSRTGYAFGPASHAVNDPRGDQSANFTGSRLTYTLTGRVTDGAGATLAGVNVTLGGAATATTQTDSFGRYLFADLPSGFDYTVTAAKTHYSFGPATQQVDDLAADATVDFNATRLKHKISGRVVDANGNGFAGALVNLVGVSGVTTDSTGNFSFDNLPAGDNYSVTASREFYDFSPSVGVFNDLGADGTVTFTATLRHFNVGGRVTEGANGVAGVTISLSGTRTATTQTDAAGNYVFASLPSNGNYTVTPATSAVYSFTPGGTTFNTLRFNETANFAAARRLYQVSGYALDACGRAIAGITMSLAHDGIAATAQTNAAGLYTFANVQAGYNYTLAPVGSAYTFTPPSFAFPGLSANQTANFTGRPPNATADVFALADLYVRGGSASSNFGTATQLITRLANQTKDTHESYLKFNVGQPCTVTSVRLRLYGQLSSSGTLPVGVYGVPVTTWTETGTTWNNKPAAGALLRTVSIPGTTAAWYEWDVTAYVRAEVAAGRSVVAFALKGTSTTNYQVSFSSREATGTNAPRLSITTP